VGQLLNVVNPLHRRTPRDYVARMVDDKVECMGVAREYGPDYWDGSRRYGYGGYHYDGRWAAVARELIRTYELKPGARILDVGCGKGFLLHEFACLLPGALVAGFDVSKHALAHAKEEVRPYLFQYSAKDPLPYSDGHFDLAISLNVLHNLPLQDLSLALREMQRVSRHQYVCVESFRDELELFNLQCWALTCESFLRPQTWTWFFDQFGFTGDYEFIYFEGESLIPSERPFGGLAALMVSKRNLGSWADVPHGSLGSDPELQPCPLSAALSGGAGESKPAAE
jgi:SAM-dependent methyltransferase